MSTELVSCEAVRLLRQLSDGNIEEALFDNQRRYEAVWQAYAHPDGRTNREYLAQKLDAIAQCGQVLTSKLSTKLQSGGN